MSDSILNHPGVRQVLFHPRRDYSRHTTGLPFVSVDAEPGIAISGRLYPADPDSSAILYYHGNGEIAADYDELASYYAWIGITLLVMDYRGYGMSSGEPTAENLVSDAHGVFRNVGDLFKAHDLSPAKLYVMGRSLGSVPAVEIALHYGDQLGGLIIESGFSDTFGLLERLGARTPGFTEEQAGFGNALKMSRITTRTLILHGERDVLIPPSDGQALYDHCAASDKRLVLIPGAGHNDIMLVGMTEYFEAIRQFVHAE